MNFWFSEPHTKHVRFQVEVEKQMFSRETDYQRIDLYTSPEFGKVLVLDGSILLTEKDEFIYHEMIAHVPMAVHPNVRRVLIIGGGDGGTLREICRYPEIERIDLVEMNEVLVKVAQKYLPKMATGFSDPRLHLIIENGLRYVRSTSELYDLIIVDSSDPFGSNESLFTREFYGNCFKALNEGGILVNQHESPYYKQDARVVREIHRNTEAVFPINRIYQVHIPTYPSGHWLFGFISKQLDPIANLDAARWNARGLKTRYYNTELHVGCFALPNYVKKLLGDLGS